ncbi:MAG TPA: methyltransferase domain-containing protein [Thermoplasmata archaeon]|nr:methyltransferase domain-containing protein [Thermoplasmata archaeon]
MAGPRRGSSAPAAAYTFSARLYDSIYAWKDYRSESQRLRALVRRFGPPGARTLLDVGCGTGSHLAHLARHFRTQGVDRDERMLRVARAKLPDLRFTQAPMDRFDLGRRFDVITCLFSAIGYVRSPRELERTLRNFARHLRPGGVAIVEPFVRPNRYRAGTVHAQLLGSTDQPIARMNLSERRGDRAIMDMHHLIGTPQGVRYWVEHHDLALYSVPEYLRSFRRAGLRGRYLAHGFTRDRGLLVGVLAPGPGGESVRVATRGSRSGRRPRGS